MKNILLIFTLSVLAQKDYFAVLTPENYAHLRLANPKLAEKFIVERRRNGFKNMFVSYLKLKDREKAPSGYTEVFIFNKKQHKPWATEKPLGFDFIKASLEIFKN